MRSISVALVSTGLAALVWSGCSASPETGDRPGQDGSTVNPGEDGAIGPGPDGGGNDTGGQDGQVPASVTYYKHVQPIIQNHCLGCHLAGGIAPFPLTSYEEVAAKANEIAIA